MSREFLNEIPEHLRSAWDKEYPENPESLKIRVLAEVEALKEKQRKTSQLYKHIFGEEHFRHMDTDGNLYMNIQIVDLKGYIDNNERLIQLFNTAADTLENLGNKTVDVPYKNSQTGEMDIAKLTFDAAFQVEQLRNDCKDILEGLSHLVEHADEQYALTQNAIFGKNDYTYLNSTARETFRLINKMINGMSSLPVRHQEFLYFKYAVQGQIKRSEIETSIKKINWPFELKS